MKNKKNRLSNKWRAYKHTWIAFKPKSRIKVLIWIMPFLCRKEKVNRLLMIRLLIVVVHTTWQKIPKYLMIISSPLEERRCRVSVIEKRNNSLLNMYIASDVLCVSDLSLNLLSISKITKDLNYELIFFTNWCVMQDLVTGVDLYKLPMEVANAPMSTIREFTFWNWVRVILK